MFQDTVNIMKAEGYKFPVFKESDAMFTADIAPEWEDGDCCHRCRVRFTLVLRKVCLIQFSSCHIGFYRINIVSTYFD